jgi:membrane fusion protein, copper/silver efflux system
MNEPKTVPKYRSLLVPGAIALGLLVAAVIYRQELRDWVAPMLAGSEPHAVEARPKPGFDAKATQKLRTVLHAYEASRVRLAKDSMDELATHAKAVAAALRGIAEHEAAAPLERSLRAGVEAADALAQAADIETARLRFGDLSRHLIEVLATDPALRQGLHMFECPMAKGFNRWVQPSATIDNPYMGQKMLACGTEEHWQTLTMEGDPADRHAHGAAGGAEIAYYTCSMHPSVKQASAGQCPICAMDLTPVTKQEVESGTLVIDDARRARIGVRTAAVAERPMTLRVRAVGAVRYDESRLHDVNLRMGGWVQRLSVDKTGQRVRTGQPLFTLYSAELYAAQLEHLAGLQRRAPGGGSQALGDLARASRQRLRLLGLTEAQVAELEQRGEALEDIPIASPASGYVVEKYVVEGARVEAGMRVFRIADLSKVWVDAEIYESDLTHVRAGQDAQVTLPYAGGGTYPGKVDYVYPTLESQTRTGRARIVLDNPNLALKPEMFANVQIDVELGERLSIPDSAVVYTGPRRLVFVDLGEGKLQPKEIRVGVHSDGFYEVTSGLESGEAVVTSGNFLIAAESRIRSAATHWEHEHESQ